MTRRSPEGAFGAADTVPRNPRGPIPVIPDPLNPDVTAANCTLCPAADVAHCDGCLACPGDAHDEACGW
jgi:hypothetical protein